MTVRELREKLFQLEYDGFEETNVEICNVDQNPLLDTSELVCVLDIRIKNNDSMMDDNKVILMFQ